LTVLYIHMFTGFSTRTVASICTVLFLLAFLIPLTKSWANDVIQAACSSDRIFGTGSSIIRTDGTNGPDIILGCNTQDIMYGDSDNDVLQGRLANDRLYGNSGDDNLEGGLGGDELYAGSGDDVIFAGPEDDFLVAGKGNDELYGEAGNDLLESGDGADYFDCGDGLDDVIVDFEPTKDDTHTNNCEDVRERL
jgi:Ca2+-binding RTX toxin-like protein